MTEMTKYKPGTFSWVDLNTTDAGGARTFYSKLFGWSHDDLPAGEAGVYTMFNIGGKTVAGMAQMSPDQQAQGMPPVWTSYVTVISADETAKKVKALGGTLMMEPMDVMDVGRMGLAQDPGGAVFAFWEPRAHIGAQVVNEPGCLSWNELATRDTGKAGEFYTRLFGWETQVQEMPQMVYTTFMVGERSNGGMMQMDEKWEGAPSRWMAYFAVADCDTSAKKVEELGGKVHVPPTDIPSVGRFSVVQDPQGADFTIIYLINPE
jgi:hypothetical protein